MSEQPWRLIAPAEEPKSAREIPAALVHELALVAKQLGLRCTRDPESRKLYLGLPFGLRPAEAPVSQREGVVYPSGSVAERHPANNDQRYAPARSSAPPLVRVVPDIKVGEHFRLGEFRPRHSAYDGVRVHPDLVRLLEDLRRAAGGPIRITSGYRPPDYNADIGGEWNSYHIDGCAADIYCDHLTTAQLHALCLRVVGERGGIGYYPRAGFCHVDIRGTSARWEG